MKPRAVTGLGVLSPLGVGRAAFVAGLAAGERPAGKDGQLEIPGFDAARHLGDKGLRSLDRLTKLLIVSARLALHDAGLKRDGAWAALSPEEVGLVVSNAYGSLEATVELDRVATLEDARYINPSRFPLTVSNSAAGYASIWEELRALNVSVSDGNCGALDAVACADVLLEQGRAKALLVGGAEAASEALLLAFQKLGAVGDGAWLGEGAALLALEPSSLARARGASVLAEIVGYGTAFEAPEKETTLLHPSPEALVRAVADALADAAVPAHDVDLVVSGVSGLRAFDEAELVGLSRALGDVGVLAPKLAVGETLGAGGALGLTTAVTLLAPGAVAPASLRVRGTLRSPPRTAVVTSVGYYGNASAVVIRAAGA
ncbi:MAG TPA: beta-ketoacyl synthase N-terminal-like domain-containing protein [Polyangiaceae bacterium]